MVIIEIGWLAQVLGLPDAPGHSHVRADAAPFGAARDGTERRRGAGNACATMPASRGTRFVGLPFHARS